METTHLPGGFAGNSRRLLLSAGIAYVLMGCAVTHEVDLNQRAKWIFAAQRDLLSREVTVRTVDGRTESGKLISLYSGSLLLRKDSPGPLLSIPLDSTKLIQPERNVGTPLLGFLGGAVAGIFIGSLVGAGSSGQENPATAHDWFVPKAADGAFAGALIGGIAFATVAGLTTAVTDYQITSSQPHKSNGQVRHAVPDSSPEGK